LPPRSKVAKLPQPIRQELERRIIEHAFSGYEALAAWLQQQGYEIAEDSVQRYGSKLLQRIESLDLAVLHAKATAHAAPADRDSILQATIDLLNERVFSTLLEAEQVEQDDLVRLSHLVSELTRIGLARHKWAQEMNSLLVLNPEKVRARQRQALATRAEAIVAVRKLAAKA